MSVSTGTVCALVFRRDLRLSFRRPDQLVQPLIFFLIVTTLFPLALSPVLSVLRDIAPGVLWVAALLSSLLAIDGIFRGDADDGTLEQLALSGHSLIGIAFAKALAHWVTSGLALVAVSPLVATALSVPPQAFAIMLLSLALGTLTLSFLGAIGSALTAGLKRGTVLLSLIVLPLATPLLIFGASALDRAIGGIDAAGPLLWLAALCAFTATLAPLAAAAAVRITVD